MRTLFLALTLAVLVPMSIATAEVVAIGAGEEAISVRVIESVGTRTVIEYEVASFETDALEIDGARYYSIALGEESRMMDRGLPALPNVCRSIIIPDDAEMAVRVLDVSFVEFSAVPVAPSKGVITRDVDPATVAYTFDPLYQTDGWYPADVATTRAPYIMRDYRGTVVVVNPFQYNPASNTLRVYDHIVVEIEQVGPATANPLTYRPETMNIEFRKIYERHFLNFEQVTGGRYPSVEDVGNMLVICYGDFMDEMAPLVEWKNQMGVPCEMVSVTDAGSSAAGINAYIEQYYLDNGLTYVLLVGDAAQCPSLTVSDLSDPSYSLITPDDYPELFVGRFSAETPAHVETQVLRSVEYEKRPQEGGDWYHKGMGVASNQGPGDDGEYDDEHEDNIRADLLAFTFTEVDQIYDPSGTASMVTNGLNDGRSILNYTGHGSTTSWGSTGFSNTHVNALVNDNMLPHGVSVACNNGTFGSTTCFAEAWLRATNGSEPTGAIGFYASSISQSWNPPMDAQDEVVDLLIAESKRTFGALCFNGCGHMMDEYGSSGVNEFVHWTLFGDPSLRVRTDTPAAVDVTHLPVFYPSMTTYDVSVATAGAREPVDEALCALTLDGVIYGSAVTDADGNATLTISEIPPVGEFLTLTVTGFNTMTYTADVQVVVPVTYDIDPPAIPVNVSTGVTVTIWDADSNPKPDVVVTIDGWSIDPIEDTTDSLGEAHFTIMPMYGEELSVVGRETGEGYNCVEDVLPVTGASSFASADVEGNVPAIGLYGALAPHYEGTITGTTNETAFTLYAVGCGVDASAMSGTEATVDLLVTPTSAGTIHAAIGKKGFDIYLEDIGVQVVYGRLAGVVHGAARDPLDGARIKGYAAGSDTTGLEPVFSATSEGGGGYAIEGDLEVAYYDVYVSKFGFLTLSEEVFVQYGANDVDFYLDSAPSGVVSGVVTEAGTGRPLSGTVKVYRADTMELYAQTSSDSLTGGSYSVTLPYFNYVMNVRVYHHIPVSQGIAVDEPSETFDFELELTDLGYDAVNETAAATDPVTWMNYDFIIWAAGDNTSPVAVEAYRTALETFVAGGGRLLIEGGEIGYDAASYPAYPSFAATVLHISSWGHDSSGSVTVEDPTHPLTTFPNTIGTISVNYVGYGDHDSNTAAADAHVVCDWSSYAGLASVQVYDAARSSTTPSTTRRAVRASSTFSRTRWST